MPHENWGRTRLDGKKGALIPGQLADLSVLSSDYFSISEEDIKRLESHLTIVGGKVVYASDAFAKLAPPELPVSPGWSPVARYGGYAKSSNQALGAAHSASCSHVDTPANDGLYSHLKILGDLGLWQLGCDCFAF